MSMWGKGGILMGVLLHRYAPLYRSIFIVFLLLCICLFKNIILIISNVFI